jgi:hypothetical protein
MIYEHTIVENGVTYIGETVDNGFEVFLCSTCGKPAYMIDPGDGLVDHVEDMAKVRLFTKE